ncbi:hypothetical protein SpCBS45565_g07455 [Spizellomyces sp. 'palustris']|nr:hypothetical protein SpCBS45565_g07455 [Spizellomyces sp. 'palustris']
MHGHHHNPNLVNTNSTAYPTQATTATGIPSTTHHHHTTPTTAHQPGMRTNNVTATGHPTTATTSHPSRVHAAVENAVGSMQSSIGRMTNNPNTVIKGEEKKVAARAEADMAKLRHAKKQHASMGI